MLRHPAAGNRRHHYGQRFAAPRPLHKEGGNEIKTPAGDRAGMAVFGAAMLRLEVLRVEVPGVEVSETVSCERAPQLPSPTGRWEKVPAGG